MASVYNVGVSEVDLFFTKGDTINLTFDDITKNGVAYDMTGFKIDIHVRELGGTLLRAFTTTGASPEISISTDSFTIYSLTGFTAVGKYKYDVQVNDGTDTLTIIKGNLFVEAEQTT